MPFLDAYDGPLPMMLSAVRVGIVPGRRYLSPSGLSMDYEVQRCTRHCCATGRELAPGEEFYSVLIAEGAELVRLDYAVEAWEGPPEGAVGWWKSQMPNPQRQRGCTGPPTT